MKTISVKVEKQYDVLVGAGLLGEAGRLIAGVDSKIQKFMIVSDSNVAPLYMAQLRASLEAAGFEVFDFVFEAGEKSKTLNTVGDILGALAKAAFTRTDAIVALGGGVATDMAGFAASIFLRGIKVFQIPTSLLAQVDASVGGKTGVDLPEGKNLVGAFWQPSLVIADTALLSSLSDQVFTEGMAEVIKYAFILDKNLYQKLLTRVTKNSPELEDVVALSRNGIDALNKDASVGRPCHYAILERKSLAPAHPDPAKDLEHFTMQERMMEDLGINVIWFEQGKFEEIAQIVRRLY